MVLDILFDSLFAVVGVAVEAPVGTGVVRTDVDAGNTAAGRTLVGIFADDKWVTDDALDKLIIDALTWLYA